MWLFVATVCLSWLPVVLLQKGALFSFMHVMNVAQLVCVTPAVSSHNQVKRVYVDLSHHRLCLWCHVRDVLCVVHV